MIANPLQDGQVCWAGRWAFNDGNPEWRQPCPDMMLTRHLVTDPDTPGSVRIWLCTKHYGQVEAQGLIDEPSPSPERLREYQRKHWR